MKRWALVSSLLCLSACTASIGDGGTTPEDEAGTLDSSGGGAETDPEMDTSVPITDSGGENPDTSVAPPVDSGKPPVDSGKPDTAAPPTDTGPTPSGVCARWKADRAAIGEGTWSGNVASCVAGDISADGRANALKLVNLYRFLAGLPTVTDDATKNGRAQACALMMHANGTLDHTPPTSWKCYTSEGASAAGQSNLSPTPGVAGVDLYMVDPGNETTMGHRRWILSNSLGPIGLGGTSGYSCMTVIGGSGSGKNAWTAWPPPGEVPIGAFKPLAVYPSLDVTGWTVQSQTINVDLATVTIKEDGVDKPVTVTKLQKNFGATHAIRIVPKGWTSQAGKSYQVTLAGVTPAIDYTVKVVACP